MAQGEATRPLETTNGSPVDTRESKSGDNSLLTQDLVLGKKLDELINETKEVRSLLEQILERL